MQDDKNKNTGDNWDENPKYADKENAGEGGGHYYYKQYTTPTGNPPPVNLPQQRDNDGSLSKTLGIIGIGEIGVNPTLAAICNAVYDATGVRYHEFPLTPERVLNGLKAAGVTAD